jgi:hypothetical protein
MERPLISVERLLVSTSGLSTNGWIIENKSVVYK